MTKKHPAEAIQELLLSKLTADGMKSLSDNADLIGGINKILKDPALVEALGALDGDQADAMKEAMAQALQMEALTKQMVEADEAGDMDALQALTDEFTKIAPGTDYAPETYDPPYDAIYDAIQDGDAAALKEALMNRPDLNVHLGKYDSFPLSWAARSFGNDRYASMQILLEHGADAGFATSDGHTALHALIDSPDREDTVACIALLLDQGADIEARNGYGWTALLAALMEGTPLVVQTLLERGANVHARFGPKAMPAFARGCTGMMVTAAEPDKIALMLAQGADPAGSHDDGRGFNAYADDIIAASDEDEHNLDFATRVEESRALINAARLN